MSAYEGSKMQEADENRKRFENTKKSTPKPVAVIIPPKEERKEKNSFKTVDDFISFWTIYKKQTNSVNERILITTFLQDLNKLKSTHPNIPKEQAEEKDNEAVEEHRMVSWEEYDAAINEIGQLQKQLKEAEQEIRDLNSREIGY